MSGILFFIFCQLPPVKILQTSNLDTMVKPEKIWISKYIVGETRQDMERFSGVLQWHDESGHIDMFWLDGFSLRDWSMDLLITTLFMYLKWWLTLLMARYWLKGHVIIIIVACPKWESRRRANSTRWLLLLYGLILLLSFTFYNRDFAFFVFEWTKHQPRRNLRSYLVLQRLCNEAALSPGIDAFWY